MKNLELNLSFSCGWKCLKSLSYYLPFPSMHISRKLESEVEIGLKPRHSDIDMGISSGLFAVRQNIPPEYVFFLTFQL